MQAKLTQMEVDRDRVLREQAEKVAVRPDKVAPHGAEQPLRSKPADGRMGADAHAFWSAKKHSKHHCEDYDNGNGGRQQGPKQDRRGHVLPSPGSPSASQSSGESSSSSPSSSPPKDKGKGKRGQASKEAGKKKKSRIKIKITKYKDSASRQSPRRRDHKCHHRSRSRTPDGPILPNHLVYTYTLW